MRIYSFFIILSLFVFETSAQTNNSKVDKVTMIKNYLNLNDNELNKIIQNDSIVAAVFETVNDYVQAEKINKRLQLYFNNEYSNKKIIAALKLERLLKDRKIKFEFDDNIDPENAIHINSAEELKAYLKKRDSIISTTLKVKDSIIIKKTKD